ncbi:hypothetical protein HK098_005842 [Nowakowskiella sp. JEL0407]|nr:hypothetical protein HK098_005842 [Nowakowskiella sp. JEL0407]
MLVVGQSTGRFVQSYSREFESEFLKVLSRRHGTKRVHANLVYQEYISDRHHIHMTATQWGSLGEFVVYLGSSGKCHVDQTEKGWFISWIDRNPETLARQDAVQAKMRSEKSAEERDRKLLEEQIKRAKELEKVEVVESTELLREDEDQKITLTIKPVATPLVKEPASTVKIANPLKVANPLKTAATNPLKVANPLKSPTNPLKSFANPLKSAVNPLAGSSSSVSSKRPLTEVEKLILEDEERKKRKFDYKKKP